MARSPLSSQKFQGYRVSRAPLADLQEFIVRIPRREAAAWPIGWEYVSGLYAVSEAIAPRPTRARTLRRQVEPACRAAPSKLAMLIQQGDHLPSSAWSSKQSSSLRRSIRPAMPTWSSRFVLRTSWDAGSGIGVQMFRRGGDDVLLHAATGSLERLLVAKTRVRRQFLMPARTRSASSRDGPSCQRPEPEARIAGNDPARMPDRQLGLSVLPRNETSIVKTGDCSFPSAGTRPR